ncbi:MAG: hypothetical protein QOH36_1277 [Actinomycetota bacterium]|nr:hypothetical protein [Actinomycetota bacterium]
MTETHQRAQWPLAAVAAVLLTTSACGSSTKAAGLTCPAHRPVGYLADDVSTTARSAAIMNERRAAIADFLTKVASCSGHAKVVAFTSSAAATRTLLDQDLLPGGATALARQRRTPAVVEAAMRTIDAELERALAELPGDGTDVLAQLQLAAEYQSQVGANRPLAVELLTDGLSTVGIDLNQDSLTSAAAIALADSATVPALPGASITFAGIGKMAGPLPPTSFVDSLKAFYAKACQRTQANCRIVTDLATGMNQ